MLRVMFDTNAYDKLVAYSEAQALTNALIASGKLTISTTHIQMDQLAAITDADKRAATLAVPATKVATAAAVWDVSKYDEANYGSDEANSDTERLMVGNPKHAADALIAVTALQDSGALVTDDKPLTKRIRALGMQLQVWRFDDFVNVIQMMAGVKKNGHDEEYMPVVTALAPVLYNLPPKIIAVDGRPGSGKTTLSRFLAWWFNVSLIESDLFLFEGEGRYRYRTDDMARIIRFRLAGDLPVIVEGVTVLRQLAAMNLAADFVIYVSNAGAPSLRREYEKQLAEYEAEFEPRQRAGFTLALDH